MSRFSRLVLRVQHVTHTRMNTTNIYDGYLVYSSRALRVTSYDIR